MRVESADLSHPARLTRRSLLRLGAGAAGAALFTALATACGSDTSSGGGSSSGSGAKATTAATTAPAATTGGVAATIAPMGGSAAAGVTTTKAPASTSAAAAMGDAGSVVMLSTQFSPVDQAERMRKTILANFKGKVDFLPDDYGPINDRIHAETMTNKVTFSVFGGLHGDMVPFGRDGLLEDLTPLMQKLGDRGFPQGFLDLARLGTTDKIFYLPWMQANYIMSANKKALQYLPSGAKIEALTYAQLKDWGTAMQKAKGQRLIGFPGGPKGLIHRFFQGYLYPSYTKSTVVQFKSPEAAQMWTEFKDLWAVTNPQSTTYANVQEPMQSEEIWVGWDHIAGHIDALQNRPNDFVTFPAPAGPKGRSFMPVLAGLAIPKGAPNRAGAEQLIDYLTQPQQQITTAKENAFFPVTSAQVPEDLSPGVKLEASAIKQTTSAPDALATLLPVGLGAKGGEFNKVYLDAFTRIVVNNEPAQKVLDEQAKILQGILNDTKAPCWAPDPAGMGVCTVA